MLSEIRLFLARNWRAVIGTAITVLFSLVIWKNHSSYRHKSKIWKVNKSLADTSLILLALQIPGLLVAWAVVWLTRPIRNSAWRATVAVLSGIVLGAISLSHIEVIILLSIFSVDLITGAQGFLADLEKARLRQEKRPEQKTIILAEG